LSEQQLGFYTLAELLRQQTRSPLDAGVDRGWRVRVVVGRFLPNMFPEVRVWENQLTFGFTDQVLRRFVALSAQRLDLTLNPVQIGAMVPIAFPASYRIETAPPLARVKEQGYVFFDARRMQPNPNDSFWLRNPFTLDSLAVALVPTANELVATVPQELVDEMYAACKKALATMKL
jgi:hypothetical protein